MHTLEILLLLLAAALALTVVARWLEVPSAVTLVVGGMVLAFIPGAPVMHLQPELALALFLPPLLQASALRTDWGLFRSNIVFILLLAFGAVLFSAAVIALTARHLIPGLGWPAAIALGAIIAPPDAVAATSVLKRFKLPKRIVAVLEGESLINDASALVLYRFAVAAALAGTTSLDGMGSSFALTAVIGVIVGLLAGAATNWAMLRLKDRYLEIVISFLAGFAAYLLAERIDGSGVLAAVACGGLIGRAQIKLAARTRLEANSAWQLVEFILASLVFLLVGLQLRGILDRLHAHSNADLLLLGSAISAALIVSRFVWVFLTFYPAAALVAVIRGGNFSPPVSYPTIISWAGMRGVVSLAAALALPENFEGRDIIVFLAFCAILSTLVVQGTTLKWLIAWFDPRDPAISAVNIDTIAARETVAAAIAGVGVDMAGNRPDPLAALKLDQDEIARTGKIFDPVALHAIMSRKLENIQAARLELKARRDAIDGETLMTLTRELDLEEEQIRLAIDGTSEPPP
ncbi:cation:proton antiporter [Sphingomonas sp. GB1N7]|uniref:cation:proton antiporter n=1 Tax=Parasphingomonas caseinilytica TaxID=3096158 RepID=UPI002FC6EDBE